VAVVDQRITLLRLVAQRIAGSGLPSVREVVGWLTAMQAQDLPGVLTSAALRTTSRGRNAVEASLHAGEVVRSWPMRGTLHLVLAEDLPWMLETAAGRVVAGAARRRAQLDLDERTLAHAREVASETLAGGAQRRREEIFAAWEKAGVSTAGQRGYHMLWHLAQTGTLCLGPVIDGDQLLVRVDEWIPQPRRLEREEALGELALRYFRSHGPASLKDFVRWAGLTVTDARAGLALAHDQLERLKADGVEHFLDPETIDRLDECRADARGVFLLPGFDELVLGYGDRSAMIPSEFEGRLAPGRNGVFQPTVVSDGRIVGTWRRNGRGAKRTLLAEPFETFSDEVRTATDRAYAALPS
jgi:hypothetical protein